MAFISSDEINEREVRKKCHVRYSIGDSCYFSQNVILEFAAFRKYSNLKAGNENKAQGASNINIQGIIYPEIH